MSALRGVAARWRTAPRYIGSPRRPPSIKPDPAAVAFCCAPPASSSFAVAACRDLLRKNAVPCLAQFSRFPASVVSANATSAPASSSVVSASARWRSPIDQVAAPCGFSVPALCLPALSRHRTVFAHGLLSRWKVPDAVRIVAQAASCSIAAGAVWHGPVHPEIFLGRGNLYVVPTCAWPCQCLDRDGDLSSSRQGHWP